MLAFPFGRGCHRGPVAPRSRGGGQTKAPGAAAPSTPSQGTNIIESDEIIGADSEKIITNRSIRDAAVPINPKPARGANIIDSDEIAGANSESLVTDYEYH